MKKILSFTILFIPWTLSFTLMPFSLSPITPFLLYYIFISLLFYIYLTLFIYNHIKYSTNINNFILFITILYILNQSFNIIVLYYNNFLLSLLIGYLSFIPLILFAKQKITI